MHFIIPKQIFDDAIIIAESERLPISQISVFIGYKNVDLDYIQHIITLKSSWRCIIENSVFNMSKDTLMLEHDGYKIPTNSYIVWLWPNY